MKCVARSTSIETVSINCADFSDEEQEEEEEEKEIEEDEEEDVKEERDEKENEEEKDVEEERDEEEEEKMRLKESEIKYGQDLCSALLELKVKEIKIKVRDRKGRLAREKY